MEDLLRFLVTYEVWIYVLIGGAALINLQKVLSGWQEWRGAVFGLERENAQRRFSSAMTVFMLLMMVALAEFLLVSFVAPAYPQRIALATPTLDVLATAESTPRVTSAAVLITPTPGGLPTLAAVTAEGCSPGKIEWTFPKSGEQLKGIVVLKGTVNLPNLGFYKYEYAPAASNTWVTIAANNGIKINTDLGGQWNTGQLTPGDYKLRLVVADSQNNILPACVIPIRIAAP